MDNYLYRLYHSLYYNKNYEGEYLEKYKKVEVLADDFLIIDRGQNMEEGIKDHDANMLKFLQRCKENSLHINPDKVQLRKKEINYIGHTATTQGIKVGEGKVEAIQKMQTPKDVIGVKRILGMCQYLTKFLPNFSDKIKALRKLTEKKQLWKWTESEEKELNLIKEAITKTPVLTYYDVNKATTIQCDASQSGLGGVLLQDEQPIAYISRALTKTETRYAQIEKELLAIVFSYEKFQKYIYGKQDIKVDSDHKPLERILQKELNDISLRMQRIRLTLQRYDLKVNYRPGRELLLADALSRSYIEETNTKEEKINTLHVLSQPMSSLAISKERLARVVKETEKDENLKKLKEITETGWLEKKKIPKKLKIYYSVRNDITEQGGLLYKDS